MEDVVSAIRKAEEAVRELPKDLRPVAFRYLLERLDGKGEAASKLRPEEARAERTEGGRRREAQAQVKIDVPRLKQFAASRNPRNHEQRVVVIAGYFEQEGTKRVGEVHLRRAYAALRWKRPGNMKQILCNVHCRKGWLGEAGPDGCRDLMDVGKDFVEHMRRR